ncbi:gamma-glutamyltransferase family protein [Salicibibacter kimchii]|uniref:Gamma-glutamyltransferase n=1 Tax=Salicibibacter kimchii TaxID=2099786 RepID=A0A345BX61_9BACI|nr:gamma-glutamyltransferase [Salicibibacter kimchii]AXF55542.1 gamma-glutamyltransferase [Salicibibacter kimchii]
MSRNMMVVMSLISVCLIAFMLIIVQDNGNEESPDTTDSVEDEDGSSPDTTNDLEEVNGEPNENADVSASHELAEEAGNEVLAEGGNAVDAAIATSLTLTVVEPYGSGIGGGGAMLVMPNANEVPDAYDYRETAPSGTSADNPAQNDAGVPGFLKGMKKVHDEHGSMDMERLLAPAIEYAEDGFEVDWMLEDRFNQATHRMGEDAKEMFQVNGVPIQEGNTLTQPELAETLTHLQEEGFEDFYSGELSSEITGNRVSWTEEDLSSYEVLTDDPASGEFGGYQVYSAPPPSSGVTLIQLLQIAEQLNVTEYEPDSAEFVGTFTEIWEIVRSERYLNIGDPSFNDIQTSDLTSLEHTDSLADEVGNEIALRGSDDEKSSTTQINVVDENGMMVSATNSLSNFFGSGVMNDAGFLMNNQMSNFAFEDEENPNYYEEGKRARSYIAPTILVSDNEGILAGSPGGARIPQVLGQVFINADRDGGDIEEAFARPRFAHHLEDGEGEIRLESEWPEDSIGDIEQLEYDVDSDYYSNVFFGDVIQLTVDLETGEVSSTEDPRR